MSYDDTVINKAKLGLQKNMFINLYQLKLKLNERIDYMINEAMESICKDVFIKPLYEVEAFSKRLENVLKQFERSTGITPNIKNLSTIRQKEFKSLLKKKHITGVGKLSLNELMSALDSYGINFDQYV